MQETSGIWKQVFGLWEPGYEHYERACAINARQGRQEAPAMRTWRTKWNELKEHRQPA